MPTHHLRSARTRIADLRSRVRRPAGLSRLDDRWGRTVIPWPRLLGLVVGVVALLILIPLAHLVFGGTDLGADGPTPWSYLDQ